jgi:hypothetical protein
MRFVVAVATLGILTLSYILVSEARDGAKLKVFAQNCSRDKKVLRCSTWAPVCRCD